MAGERSQFLGLANWLVRTCHLLLPEQSATLLARFQPPEWAEEKERVRELVRELELELVRELVRELEWVLVLVRVQDVQSVETEEEEEWEF